MSYLATVCTCGPAVCSLCSPGFPEPPAQILHLDCIPTYLSDYIGSRKSSAHLNVELHPIVQAFHLTLTDFADHEVLKAAAGVPGPSAAARNVCLYSRWSTAHILPEYFCSPLVIPNIGTMVACQLSIIRLYVWEEGLQSTCMGRTTSGAAAP